MKLCYLTLAALVAGVYASSSDPASVLESLDIEDIKQYLKDSGQEAVDVGSAKLQDLKKLAIEQWQKNAAPKPWWNFWKDEDSYYDSAKLWVNDNLREPTSNWLFETWPRESLVKLLKDAGIKTDASASADALVEKARRQYNKLSKKLGTAGKYPSPKFFDSWSEEDLASWLDEYNIKYNKAKHSRDELVSKVRKNIRKATEFYEDERYELLTNLDVLDDEFERKGNFNHVDFKTWSPKNLERWLRLHKIKIDDKLIDGKDYLVNLAVKNKNTLDEDLNWLGHYAKKNIANMYTGISNSPQQVVDAADKVWDATIKKAEHAFDSLKDTASDNIINDTFLVDVEYWPKDKLKQFLTARGVSYPYLATRNHLMNLAKEHRNRPIKQFDHAVEGARKWFDKLTLENLQKWSTQKRSIAQDTLASAADEARIRAADAGAAIQDKAKDVGDAVQDKVKDFGGAAQDKARHVGNAVGDKANDARGAAKDSAKGFGDAVQEQSHKLGDAARNKIHDWTESFDSWSADDLASYLHSYGLRFPPSFSKDRLVALAKSHSISFFGRPVVEEKPSYLKYLLYKPRQWVNYGYTYLFRR